MKKNPNYSSLLLDMKASSINDKIKGRNYKMNIKKVGTNFIDKPESLGVRVTKNSTDKLIPSSTTDKRRNLDGSIDYSRKITDNNITDNTNLNTTNDIHQGKIDIKISVNYGKPQALHNNMTNAPSRLSNSKSFFHNSQINNGLNQVNSEYLSNIPPNEKVTFNSNILKDKLIKSLKNKVTDDRSIKSKLANQKEINELINSSHVGNINYNSSNNHKRNQSDCSNFFQNNLNISLMNYESKKHLNKEYDNKNISTGKNVNTNPKNNSFTYTPQLFNHYSQSEITPGI